MMTCNQKTLKGRYRLTKTLGKGGFATTYEAIDLKENRSVAIKVVVLRQVKDWKVIDLLERETATLKSLYHPAIPQYLDSFEVETRRGRCYCLVQELAPGLPLTHWINQGWTPTAKEIERVAEETLEILCYLQSLVPPIIHRDIKPQNLLRDRTGKIYLVDFGSVQDTYRHTVTGGSTIVGTFGYMAPEQFRGQAALPTDLYGLGTTLIFLLTRTDPAKLPEQDFRVDYRSVDRSAVSVDYRFGQWLDCMIEPVLEKRLPTADVALQILQGDHRLLQVHQQGHPQVRQLAGRSDRVFTKQTLTSLTLYIGPQGLRDKTLRQCTLAALLSTGLMMTLYMLLGVDPDHFSTARSLLWIGSCGGAIASMICIRLATVSSRLTLSKKGFSLYIGNLTQRRPTRHNSSFLFTDIPAERGDLSELKRIIYKRPFFLSRINTSVLIGNGVPCLVIGVKLRHFVLARGLSPSDQRRVMSAIANFLIQSDAVCDEKIAQIVGDEHISQRLLNSSQEN